VSGIVLVLTTYPRWDLLHLFVVSPAFLFLAAAWMERISRPTVAFLIFALFLTPAIVMCCYGLRDPHATAMKTPVGRIRVATGDVPAVKMCLSRIPPGSKLFVFPYQPIFYFLTGARNPTRFDFMQPGMMSFDDEEMVVSELKRRPPELILYSDVPVSAYLRVWPSSDPSRLRLNLIENFIQSHYTTTPGTATGAEFQLLASRL
jgi:hypothetical protein